MLEDQKLMGLVKSRREAMSSMMREHAGRTRGCDRVEAEPDRGRVLFLKGGTVHWDARAELIGIFMTDIERWRWWWVLPGAETAGKLRLDAAFAAGKEGGIHTLTARTPPVSTEKDASLLAQLCASLAGANGVYAESAFDRITYYALFVREPEAGQQYNTMLPPASMGPPSSRLPGPPASPPSGLRLPPPPRSPMMSMAPEAPSPASDVASPPSSSLPRQHGPARVPSRELVRPLALHAHTLVTKQLAGGFRQAVVVLYTENRGGKVRFSVSVVASDRQGDLVVLDSTPEMMQAIQTLLSKDARSGNGPWTRLTVLLASTPSGASMDVQIKA